jgi:hypothetical protein
VFILCHIRADLNQYQRKDITTSYPKPFKKKKTTTYGVEVHVNKYVRHRRIVPMNERDSRGDDRMVVSFISTYAISVTNVHGSMSMHFLYQSSGMGTHFYL